MTMLYRSLRVRRDMSPAGIVRIIGDILCEHVRNNCINSYRIIWRMYNCIQLFLF